MAAEDNSRMTADRIAHVSFGQYVERTTDPVSRVNPFRPPTAGHVIQRSGRTPNYNYVTARLATGYSGQQPSCYRPSTYTMALNGDSHI